MLDLKASEIMTREVTTVAPDRQVQDLLHLFRVSGWSGVPVVGENGHVVGVVSETDILRALAYALGRPAASEFASTFQKGKRKASQRLLEALEGGDRKVGHWLRSILELPVRDLMTPVVHTCSPDDSLAKIAQTMSWKEIHRVVVVDDQGRVVGLITALDVMSKLSEILGGGARPSSAGDEAAGES